MIYGKDIEYNVKLYNEKYRKFIDKFDCTNNSINKYLKEKAYDDMLYGRTVTRLIFNKQNDRIIGFYTLITSALVVGTGITDNHFYSAIEIKFFAIDKEYQHIRYDENDDNILSDYLLSEVIDDINEITLKNCGAEFVILYSVPRAIHFYKDYGFKLFNDFIRPNTDNYLGDCQGMFMNLSD